MSEGQSFERARTPEPIDKEWYDRLEEAGHFAVFEYLDGDAEYRKQQREKFEAGEIENPTLDYPRINVDDLNTKEAALLALKKDVLEKTLDASEKMSVVQQVYRWRINEKIAQVRLLQAIASGDQRRFQRYSDFVFGKPSQEVFEYTIRSLRDQIDRSSSSDNEELKHAMSELSEILPSTSTENRAIVLPDDGTIQTSKEETLSQLGDLVHVPEGDLDATVIKQAFESALQSLKTEGWKVVLDKNRPNISVSQREKTVKIPPDRKLLAEKLKGLVLHEIGTHVARREGGERAKLKLLALGLDRYDRGEEGIATMREQVFLSELKDYAGLDGHLAISLALGMDGTPRNFREVYTIMHKYYVARELDSGASISDAQKTANTEAWNRCVRTFRGTNCKTRGVAYTGDIVYREGNIAVWDLIKTNPEEMKRFNVGKYDPSNERHVWVLTELGIGDEDLTSLEQTS